MNQETNTPAEETTAVGTTPDAPEEYDGKKKSARLPRHAKAVDLHGQPVGKIRRSILKDKDGNPLGKFFKENGEVYFKLATENDGEYKDFGYVDANNNILENGTNRYYATVRYFRFALWIPILICALFLMGGTTLLASWYISRFEDYVPTLFVATEGGEEWHEDEDIGLFKSGLYGGTKIYPGMKGEYKFRLENRNDNRLEYALTFAEENEYDINLQFRLMLDGAYVKGDANTYVDIDELDLDELIITPDSAHIYTIEWKWVDAANDTEAGMNNATYTIHITFSAKTTVYFN